MRTLTIAALATLPLLAGCNTARTSATQPGTISTPLTAPNPALAPLTFMSGQWASADAAPGKAFNEEHWTPVRGDSLVGTFRRLLANGRPALVELTSIVALPADEKTNRPAGVYLHLRHFHGRLEMRKNEMEPTILKLTSTGPNTATFEPHENGRGLARVTYSSPDPNTLLLNVEYDQKALPQGQTKVPDEFIMRRLTGDALR